MHQCTNCKTCTIFGATKRSKSDSSQSLNYCTSLHKETIAPVAPTKLLHQETITPGTPKELLHKETNAPVAPTWLITRLIRLVVQHSGVMSWYRGACCARRIYVLLSVLHPVVYHRGAEGYVLQYVLHPIVWHTRVDGYVLHYVLHHAIQWKTDMCYIQ